MMILILVLLQAVICAFLSYHVAEEKKYSGITHFILGFLFGIFGLIATAGLPINLEYSEFRQFCTGRSLEEINKVYPGTHAWELPECHPEYKNRGFLR